LTSPSPALTTQRAAQRLPRWALLLLCAAYVLPGVFGRDPWRSADLTAFAYMQAMAEGRADWMFPTIGGQPADGALLPYWVGAIAIRALPFLDGALAARLPFAALLAATLSLIWYAAYHLARTEAAQPVPFAFGGEAAPVDYARALADGALLATIATLGLLQLGHETTPELMQLCATAGFLWALAVAPDRPVMARWTAPVSLVVLSTSGAPSIAFGFAAAGLITCLRSSHAGARRLVPFLALGAALAIAAGVLLKSWAWRIGIDGDPATWAQPLRTVAWFTWPTWPFVLWTLWRWRSHWQRRHIAVPAVLGLVALGASWAMGGSDRALMLATPSLAVLAAFALPTFERSVAALVDWFSVFFFTILALAMWVIYLSVQTGMPPQPARNVARLAQGFTPSFSLAALLLAALGSAAWAALVRWRTARHQHALWKSMALPAGGVALMWLLAMTLGLPILDYARSPRPLVADLLTTVPRGSCVQTIDMSKAQLAALEVFGDYRPEPVDGDAAATPTCPVRLVYQADSRQGAPDYAGWVLVGSERRPTDRDGATLIYRTAP